MNEGKSWERISPDLTYNDDNKKGDIPYQTIFTISESPLKFGLIYAGTDDGRAWVTKNSGTNWEEINKGLPYGKWVSQMEASRFAEGRVYMSQNGKRDDDFAAYVWKSEDYGQTWEDISRGIPCGPVNVIREDPKNEDVLYVGTDYGVYISLDKGETWDALCGDLPTTYVHDLVIHPRDDIAVIGTHGRGVWAIDVLFIREVANISEETNCKIFDFEDCMLPFRSGNYYRRTMKPLNVPFYLSENKQVWARISGEEGEVKELKIEGVKGLNYIDWDLTNSEHEFVTPGGYKLQITGNGISDEKEFEIKEFRRR